MFHFSACLCMRGKHLIRGPNAIRWTRAGFAELRLCIWCHACELCALPDTRAEYTSQGSLVRGVFDRGAVFRMFRLHGFVCPIRKKAEVGCYFDLFRIIFRRLGSQVLKIQLEHIPNGHRARPKSEPRLAGMDWLRRLNATPYYRPRLVHLDRLPLSAELWPVVVMEIGRLDSVQPMLLPDNRPNVELFCPIEWQPEIGHRKIISINIRATSNYVNSTWKCTYF